MSDLVVDVHSHFFPREFVRLVREDGPPYGASVERRNGVDVLAMPGHAPTSLGPQFIDPEARLFALKPLRITVQVLSLSPPMVYWAPGDLGQRLAQAFNDGIGEICVTYPGRFMGLATLPMQDVRASLAEMERANRDLGMRGIYVGTSVRGHYLHEPQFWPIWELAQELGMLVCTHPQSNLGGAVFDQVHLWNSVGFPVETTVMVARLIYAGVFERWKNLRLALAHAGGTFPLLLGRLDHSYRNRPECRGAIPQPPSAYVKHLFFDTVTHSDLALRFLIDTVGPAHVLVGSDAPYDMADGDPVARVRRLNLPPDQEAAVLGSTAMTLLGIEQRADSTDL